MKENIKSKLLIIIITIILCLTLILAYLLYTNKTFFKTTYISANKQEIFVPQYSYFKEDCCMYVATFYSLRNKNDLQNEINDYLKDFTYLNNENGYIKDNLLIIKYIVEDKGMYRIISIQYDYYSPA